MAVVVSELDDNRVPHCSGARRQETKPGLYGVIHPEDL
jgi:hypothetical protein